MDFLLYLIIIVLAFALAIWSYSGQRTGAFPKWIFWLLRGLSLSIVGILLADPTISIFGEEQSRKKVMLALDNSASIGIKKGSYAGIETAKLVNGTLLGQLENRVDLKTILFDEKVLASPADQAAYNGNLTDLSAVLEHARQEYDLAALILSTDGIVTFGKDPSFQIQDIGFPVYAVALGDTGVVDDIWVDELDVPDQVYTDTDYTVQALIGSAGFSGRTLDVEVKDGDRVLVKKNVTVSKNEGKIPVKLTLRAKEKGLQTLTLQVVPQSGEFTNVNNTSTFNVDVKSGKTRILHLAYDLNPDVKVIRQILENDASVELYAYAMTSLGKFIGQKASPVRADTFELLVVHGLPNYQQLNTLNPFEGIWKDRPKMVFAGPSSRFESIQNLDWFPAKFSGFPDWRPIGLFPLDASLNHPVTSNLERDIQKFAPLTGSVRQAELKPGAIALFNSGFLGSDTGAPAVILRQVGRNRTSFLLPFGYASWYISPDLQSRAFLEELVLKISQWTAAEPEAAKSVVRPVKPVFSTSEDISFEAEIRNESGEADNAAMVSVRFPSTELSSFSFKKEKQGQFSSNIGKLQPGRYAFEASVVQGDKNQLFTGTFDVTEQQIESANLIRNQSLLKQLTSSTGGKLVEPDSISNLLQELELRGLTKPAITWKEQQFQLRTFWLWFALVLLLLSAEWLLRKRISVP